MQCNAMLCYAMRTTHVVPSARSTDDQPAVQAKHIHFCRVFLSCCEWPGCTHMNPHLLKTLYLGFWCEQQGRVYLEVYAHVSCTSVALTVQRAGNIDILNRMWSNKNALVQVTLYVAQPTVAAYRRVLQGTTTQVLLQHYAICWLFSHHHYWLFCPSLLTCNVLCI